MKPHHGDPDQALVWGGCGRQRSLAGYMWLWPSTKNAGYMWGRPIVYPASSCMRGSLWPVG